jgi:hypothetical protein
MYSQDLEIARRRLEEEKLTMAIVKRRRVVFATKSHGVAGFIEAIEKVKSRLCDASVADKVVGKAIALLCVYAKVKSVYAETISKAAKSVLESNSICLEHGRLVDRILSADKTGICPFEQLMEEITNPTEAYVRLKAACCPASVSI